MPELNLKSFRLNLITETIFPEGYDYYEEKLRDFRSWSNLYIDFVGKLINEDPENRSAYFDEDVFLCMKEVISKKAISGISSIVVKNGRSRAQCTILSSLSQKRPSPIVIAKCIDSIKMLATQARLIDTDNLKVFYNRIPDNNTVDNKTADNKVSNNNTADNKTAHNKTSYNNDRADRKKAVRKIGLPKVLDFMEIKKILSSQNILPEGFIFLNREISCDGSWSDLYIKILQELCTVDNHRRFLINREGKAIFLNIRQHDIERGLRKNNLRKPVCFLKGFYAETDLNAEEMLFRIKRIIEICQIGYSDLRIFYSKTDAPVVPVAQRKIAETSFKSEVEIKTLINGRVTERRVKPIAKRDWFKTKKFKSKIIPVQESLFEKVPETRPAVQERVPSGRRVHFRTLSLVESAQAMSEWEKDFTLPVLRDDDMNDIRNELHEIAKKVKEKCASIGKREKYFFDVGLGIDMYVYFRGFENFTIQQAADDGFWRYLSLKVIPDVVGLRYSKDNQNAYWKRSARLWLKNLWWYVYFSYNNDISTTRQYLLSDCFSTDTIAGFADRIGENGVHTDVYRMIVKKFVEFYSAGRFKVKTEDAMRKILKLHTAKILVIEPVFFQGGIEGYVNKLFIDAGVI